MLRQVVNGIPTLILQHQGKAGARTQPWNGRWTKGKCLPLFDLGGELGESLTNDAVGALGGSPISYGKAAIVGIAGDLEQLLLRGGVTFKPEKANIKFTLG